LTDKEIYIKYHNKLIANVIVSSFISWKYFSDGLVRQNDPVVLRGCLDVFDYFLLQWQKVMPSGRGDKNYSNKAFNLEKNADSFMLRPMFTYIKLSSAQSDSHILQKHLTISGQTLERFFQYGKNAYQSAYWIRKKFPLLRRPYLWTLQI